jgi:hypothetical protein
MADLKTLIGDALNAVGVQNTGAIQGVVNMIGTIADIAGAASGIAGAISFVSSFISQSNGIPPALQNILNTIQNELQQISESQKAEDIIQKRSDIANQLAPALTAVDSLNALVSQLPLQPYQVLQQLQPCVDAINALGADAKWVLPYNDQVSWNDWQYLWPPQPWWGGSTYGYGEEAPPGNSDGTVFAYTYILPAYIDAVFSLLSVGACIDPDFVQNWSDTVLRPAATLLQSQHDLILSNITPLTPGQWNGQILASHLTINQIGELRVLFPMTGVTPTLNTASFPEVDVVGTTIEYGAVEKFAGISSVGLYELVPPFSLQSTDWAPYNKFLIRLARRFKVVYCSAGLLTVWNAINHLKTITGDSPLPDPSPGVWSFKRDIIPVAGVAPQNGYYSLNAIAAFIKNTLPIDTPQLVLFKSFQTLLTV